MTTPVDFNTKKIFKHNNKYLKRNTKYRLAMKHCKKSVQRICIVFAF